MDCLERYFRKGPTAPVLKQLNVNLFSIIHFSVNTFTNREWGFGEPEDAQKFNPVEFDAEQIVRSCRDGGLMGIVLVCKHHDGFCLWPTKTTDYNISNCPWRGGKGDIVREISDACRKFGVKFGVYISPWDRNCAIYGTPEYVTDIFEKQIREVLTQYGEIFEMWFDGANGGDGYYGGAREKRNIGIAKDYYNWDRIFGIVRELQPDARIFCGGPDMRWCGNERGHIPPDCSSYYSPFDFDGKDQMTPDERYAMLQTGCRKAPYFVPAECDFPLRQGWFYHPESDGLSRSSLVLLMDYLNTVGNGGVMNLGISPDRRGLITDEDARKLKGFNDKLKMLRETKVFEFSVTGAGRHEFEVPADASFDVLEFVEDIEKADGEKVEHYSVTSDGKTLAEGNVIGMRRIRLLKSQERGGKLVLELEGDSFVRLTGWLAGKDLLAPDEVVDKVFEDPAFEDVTGLITASDANSITIDLGRARTFNGFVLTPDPDDREGLPLRYALKVWDDGEEWRWVVLDEGFENIQANPIPQRVRVKSTTARYLQFLSFQAVREGAPMKIRAFAILKQD